MTKKKEKDIIRVIEQNTNLINHMIDKYTKKTHERVIPYSIDIKTETNKYLLIRLNDGQYSKLRKKSLSIFENYYLFMSLGKHSSIFSSFAKMYVSLKSMFGESGSYYDSWKGAFSFPFLIHFVKDDEELGYLLNVSIVRSIELKFYKLVSDDDERYKKLERDALHKPFDDFPKDEMEYFCNFFIGFLEGYFEILQKSYNEPFVKAIKSNLVIFGYQDGHFFDMEYEKEKEFNNDLKAFLKVKNGRVQK